MGNDLDNTLTGNGSSDQFSVGTEGHDVITDFEAGIDRIGFADTGLSFEDLLLTSQESDLLINYGDHTLLVSGATEGDLDEEAFIF